MRDEGRYGFVLPAAQIIPNARGTLQTLIVVKIFLRYLNSMKYDYGFAEVLESVKVYANKVAEELGKQ
jgi:hypothetical protein